MNSTSNQVEAAPGAQVEVSVVIPCLNEAASVAFCIDKALEAFAAAGVDGEVVVADNGSTDGSIQIAQEHGARLVHVQAKGYGNALRRGIEAARGEFIIMGDADDSYDFSEVPRFIAKWREGYELVMGNRFKGEIKPGAMPWSHRYFGNPGLSKSIRTLFHAPVGDAYCGMRGFAKQLYQHLDLRATGMEFALEMAIKAAKMGARITEIPITLWPDKRGRAPHLRTFHDGWRSLRFILLFAPNWLFLYPGVFLLLAGAGIVFWLLPGPQRVGTVTFDVHTMLFGMIFVLLGMQIILTGLFAKVFSYSERFDRQQRSLERLFRNFQLEHGLLIGSLLALGGFAGDAAMFGKWVASDFGHFHDIRAVIFFSLLFFLGVQTIFSSFFISMLGISRDTYIGDYDIRQGKRD